MTVTLASLNPDDVKVTVNGTIFSPSEVKFLSKFMDAYLHESYPLEVLAYLIRMNHDEFFSVLGKLGFA